MKNKSMIDLAFWYMMLVTPDLEPEYRMNTTINEIEPNNFEINGNNDFYHDFSFKLKITEYEKTYKFDVYESAYSDTGISIYDKNLNLVKHM